MTSAFISSVEQARHYFQQPSIGVPTSPIGGEAAWLGRDLKATPERWSFDLTTNHIGELDAALLASADVPIQGSSGIQKTAGILKLFSFFLAFHRQLFL